MKWGTEARHPSIGSDFRPPEEFLSCSPVNKHALCVVARNRSRHCREGDLSCNDIVAIAGDLPPRRRRVFIEATGDQLEEDSPLRSRVINAK